MSGARKKWTKQVKREKRDFSTIITPEVAEEMKKAIPGSKLLTPGKLAERFKISVTLARKVLATYAEEGKIQCNVAHHSLHVYGRVNKEEETA